MSKNWRIIFPTAKVYDILWSGKTDTDIEEFSFESPLLEMPKKTHAHLWLFRLSDFKHESFQEVLSGDERAKLNQLLHPVERLNRTKSRIALRLILAEYLQLSPSELEFSYSENAKPKLTTAFDRISFNISHSGNNLAILIDTQRSIGVDIEAEFRPPQVGIQLAKRFFHEEEVNFLKNAKSEEQSELFSWLWTLKEAVLKSSGTGIFSIESAPNFTGILQKNNGSRIQFYTTNDHSGFTFRTDEFCLSAAAMHQH